MSASPKCSLPKGLWFFGKQSQLSGSNFTNKRRLLRYFAEVLFAQGGRERSNGAASGRQTSDSRRLFEAHVARTFCQSSRDYILTGNAFSTER